MNICVVGTGYVGLVTGTCFAETGNRVICMDIDEKKVDMMRAAQVPIYEPGLNVLFERNTKIGRLSFTTSLEEGVEESEIIFLALPTPPGEGGSADLQYILGVATDLGKIIKNYKVVVGKSTVPVGTSEKVSEALGKNLSEELFDVVSNPEFLREGVAVDDFMRPDRVVIGTRSERARNLMAQLYEPFVRQGNPIIFMDEKSSEMTKYASNSYLATRITFMNEIANLCEKIGANVDMVRKGMGSDNRIGKRFLFPGVGYGGSCFPKDVQALTKTAKDCKYNFQILESVIQVNDRQKAILADKILNYFGHNVSGKIIGIWGLAFKPNTDDVREAPALYTIDKLLDNGAKIKAYDPEAMDNVKAIYGDKIQFAMEPYEAAEKADALAIVTEWNAFRTPNFDTLRQKLNNPVIFDGRNLYDVNKMKGKGFYYSSIGRELVLN